MWQRISSPFQEFGALDGALYAVDRVLRRLSPAMGLYVYELTIQPIEGKPLLRDSLARNLSFVEIGRGHPDVERMPARPEIKELRFEQGARCLGVYRRGELIGYIWFGFGMYREDEVRCDYELARPEESVFDFDLYVMPEHRMGLGFIAVWHCANLYLRERGVRHTFSRVTRFNIASRRSHALRGLARAIFLKVGKLEAMVATHAPYFAMTWSDRRRVRIRLAPDTQHDATTPTAATEATSSTSSQRHDAAMKE
jgi:hypothetical protein